jgi:apolipoprotein N-acyltransferase
VSAGIPICYELLFPDLVRRFVAEGAQVLLAITNDAWYGRTGAPYQFLAITALRSAETGVWTARAANTGVSAFIDERGRVREQTPIFETGLLVADVPLRSPEAPRTYYVRHGDVFAWGCWAALAVTAGAAWRRSRNAGGR